MNIIKHIPGLLIAGTLITLPLTGVAGAHHHAPYYVNASVAGTYDQLRASTIIAQPNPNPYYLPSQALDTTAGENSALEYGFQFGRVFQIAPRWHTEVGAGIYLSSAQKVSGNYWQSITPAKGDPTMTFNYKIKTQHYMLESNLFYQLSHKFSLFYGFGLGISRLHSSTLSMTGDGSYDAPVTHETANNHIAVEVGTGVDYAFNKHWHLQGSIKKAWLGTNTIFIQNGPDSYVTSKQVDIKPWSAKVAISYRFS